jgi:hypothetical protein
MHEVEACRRELGGWSEPSGGHVGLVVKVMDGVQSIAFEIGLIGRVAFRALSVSANHVSGRRVSLRFDDPETPPYG